MLTDEMLLESPPLRAWWSLARAYHSMASRLSRFFEERGVTGAQFGVLRCLWDAAPEPLMLTDLSKRLLVTCGNITGVVDRLEQAGYIRRERDEADRRVILARLTPEGEQFYREVLPEFLRLVAELEQGLSGEEQDAIAGCCEKLHCSLEHGRTPEAPLFASR
jgi:DNA-binding MarR family transcriptional regulator